MFNTCKHSMNIIVQCYKNKRILKLNEDYLYEVCYYYLNTINFIKVKVKQ